MKSSFIQKILAFPFSYRQKSLSKTRPPLSKSAFVFSIGQHGGDLEAAEIIYTKLQDWVYHEEFTPYPDDSLGSVFGIAEEELDEDLILDIFRRLGISTPSEEEVVTFGAIDTAADVSRLVALARRSTS